MKNKKVIIKASLVYVRIKTGLKILSYSWALGWVACVTEFACYANIIKMLKNIKKFVGFWNTLIADLIKHH